MRWSVIQVIWFREVRDQLRDRRTIFMLIALPLLLYPGLGMVMTRFAFLFGSQTVTIGVAGHEWLRAGSDADQLIVEQAALSAFPGPAGLPTAPSAVHQAIVQLYEHKGYVGRLPPLLDADERHFAGNLFREGDDPESVKVVLGDVKTLESMIRRREIHAYVVINRDFVQALGEGKRVSLNIHLEGGTVAEDDETEFGPVSARADVVLGPDDDRGRLAYERLQPIFLGWREEILRARMRTLGAPLPYYKPLRIPALEPKIEKLWSRMFPFLIVMMSLTGALYPAIDLCAGEKERGTMETLLISPASRAEIVWGKFLTVWVFSAATALLNLASLGFTAWQFSHMISLSNQMVGSGGADIPAPGIAAMSWCVVLLIPLAAFFSAISLAVAAYARSTKEGQYYLMPLMLATLLMTLVTLSPGAELSPVHSLLPITGAALLLQALMNAQTADQVPWLYLGPVLLPLAAYCYLALYWATQQFNREEVLFREAERLDLGLWVKRLFREKQPYPSATQAITCFILILLLHWFVGASAGAADILTQTGVLQVACIATPALLMAVLLTSRPLLSLRVRWPLPQPLLGVPFSLQTVGWFGVVLVLAAALHVPLVALMTAVVRSVPQIRDHLEALERLIRIEAPLGAQILILAALPAICEELAFRGFILRGLERRLGPGKAIFVSSLLFAFAHLNAFQFLATFALGLVLGLLATRSGSLLPGVLFHFAHNGLAITVAHFIKTGHSEITEETVYSWPLVIASTTVALVLLAILYRLPSRSSGGEKRESVSS